MTDCPDGLMRDLLPEYAHGVLREEDAARVAAHVATCEACRAELALLTQVRTGLALGVPRVNAVTIVSALPPPLATPATVRALPRRWMPQHVWQYATAAGLVLAVGGGIVWRSTPETAREPQADSTVARGAAAESTQASRALLADDGLTFGGGLSDLSLDDLQTLMGQVDSVRTLPSKDPESVTLVIANNEGGKTL